MFDCTDENEENAFLPNGPFENCTLVIHEDVFAVYLSSLYVIILTVFRTVHYYSTLTLVWCTRLKNPFRSALYIGRFYKIKLM